jgi:hypothetical protein
MPKTAVDKYHLVPGWKHEVRFAWKVCPMEAETVPEAMNKAPHRHFGLRVLVADCAHVLAAIHKSSFLEFLKEPIQNRALFFLPRPPNLR